MMDAGRMEQAIAGCTAWIKQRWPELPPQVFVDRDNLLGTYLAFLAIRHAITPPRCAISALPCARGRA